MKKILLSVLAVAALASCAKEETLTLPQGDAIAFGDAFVDNTTKAIYGEGDPVVAINSFKVWGNVTGNSNTVALYPDAGATVTNPTSDSTGTYGSAWACSETRYWTPSCTYNFAAIVDGDAKTIVDGLPTVISYPASGVTADGTQDLLYGTVTGISTNDKNVVAGLKNNCVAFTMNHLLSRVAFKFTNNSGSADYTYTVKNINITGAFTTGQYVIANETWTGEGSMTNPLSFGDITTAIENGATANPTGAYVIIPGAPKLTVSFNAEVVFGGKVISTVPYSLTLNQTDADKDQTFEANYAYTFSVELPAPGDEIQFSIEKVDGFTTAGSDVTIQ